MAKRQFLPVREVLRGRRLSWVDLVVGSGLIALLYGVVKLGRGMTVNVTAGHTLTHISTNFADVPYYAARSLLRMFIALAISIIFTFVYGAAAARLRRSEKVLIPILDVLQSIPILVFLPVALTFFVRIFPNSELGLELAAIFVIFTSQAWNMTFSFYHSLITQPTELDEAARMYRLTKWQRFWKLDVPSSMIGLVWNMMMSMGGGWFFLTASEAVTVFIKGKGVSESLPGMGSYMAAAVQKGSYVDVAIAIGVMIVLVIGTNFFVFRPLVAWADKFRLETSESADKPKSIVFNVLRRSSIPKLLGRALRPVGQLLDRVTRPFGLAEYPLYANVRRRQLGDVVFWLLIVSASLFVAVFGLIYINAHLGFSRFPSLLGYAFATFGRVVVLLILSTIIWVPIGVKIGMSPKLSRYAQPIVQVLASFPAILLFPFATLIFIDIGLSLNVGAIFLMMLGAQWYILFNVIAGASSIPNDLLEMMVAMRLTRWQRWRDVILPAIFPAYVTGGVTAAGGAWNASIVAEFVSWHHKTLHAYGLGNYIAVSSSQGRFAALIAGGVVMSVFVVVVNRLFWRRLYHMAERRFTL
ncbi:MAG: ABC transporter permease subunit [Acidimicrobiales bacterium]